MAEQQTAPHTRRERIRAIRTRLRTLLDASQLSRLARGRQYTPSYGITWSDVAWLVGYELDLAEELERADAETRATEFWRWQADGCAQSLEGLDAWLGEGDRT